MELKELRAEVSVDKNGAVTVQGLPLTPGERVEVRIVRKNAVTASAVPQSLRGTVTYYEQPTEPVAEEDWHALK